MAKTKYPILLVHGIGLRGPVYWGRIPAILAAAGATVYISRQDAFGTLQHNTAQLRHQLSIILRFSGAGKVNIIAHSKGGLEARCLAATPFGRRHIASITTIGTPHHGSHTAAALLRAAPAPVAAASRVLNALYRRAGDEQPDVLTVLHQLTPAQTAKLGRLLPPPRALWCQSYTSGMGGPAADRLMALPYAIVRRYDGENDGLGGTTSAQWQNFQACWPGASHLGTMDLLRRPSTTMQVRRWYLGILHTLQKRGL